MDNDDRISSLPEEIRFHIVSFLPMEEAIRTSVLSTKWRKVCSSLSNFSFYHDDNIWTNEFNLKRFKRIVYQTISQHDNSDINNFSLNLDSIQEDQIDEIQPHLNQWVSFAVNHNVRELDVLGVCGGLLKQLSVCFVTSCNSLEELKLSFINLNLLTNVRFLNLKTLLLNCVQISSVSVINQLFSSCPVLEVLEIPSISLEYKEEDEEVEDPFNDFILIIPSPNLKVLEISGWTRHRNHQIKFFSKNLHKLGYHGEEPPSFGLDIIPSCDEAKFDVTTGLPSLNNTVGENHWASKILMNLCNVTKLYLGTFYLEFLTRERVLLERLPSCFGLKHLHVDLYPTKNQAEVITLLLRSYPNLQTLHISIKSLRGYDDFFNMEEHWKTQELNTDGMLKQLRSVDIESFEGSEFELAFVSFLLQNADVMEKMDVLLSKEYKNDTGSSSSIKEKIKMIASVSPNAAVSVLEIYSVNDFLAWEWARAKYECNSSCEPRQ